jgi:hypothetical protein
MTSSHFGGRSHAATPPEIKEAEEYMRLYVTPTLKERLVESKVQNAAAPKPSRTARYRPRVTPAAGQDVTGRSYVYRPMRRPNHRARTGIHTPGFQYGRQADLIDFIDYGRGLNTNRLWSPRIVGSGMRRRPRCSVCKRVGHNKRRHFY